MSIEKDVCNNQILSLLTEPALQGGYALDDAMQKLKVSGQSADFLRAKSNELDARQKACDKSAEAARMTEVAVWSAAGAGGCLNRGEQQNEVRQRPTSNEIGSCFCRER